MCVVLLEVTVQYINTYLITLPYLTLRYSFFISPYVHHNPSFLLSSPFSLLSINSKILSSSRLITQVITQVRYALVHPKGLAVTGTGNLRIKVEVNL